MNLDRILCIKTERTLRNDFTVAHNGTLYQIQDKNKSTEGHCRRKNKRDDGDNT